MKLQSLLLAVAALATTGIASARNVELLNVSYDPTRELYAEFNKAFAAHWKAKTGDNVIIVNADKIKLTGKKAEQRIFYWHSGFPGGLKEHTPRNTLAGRYPERVVYRAIERMMPKDSPLAREQMRKLKVYAGAVHPHEAQTPEVVDIAGRNRKNKP